MQTSDLSVRRLRVLAFVEGSSLLVLVAIAVPLKHVLGFPGAVQVVGPLHGLAFLAYAMAIIDALGTGHLAWRRAGIAIAAAMIPGGSFLFARSIVRRSSHEAGNVPGSTQH